MEHTIVCELDDGRCFDLVIPLLPPDLQCEHMKQGWSFARDPQRAAPRVSWLHCICGPRQQGLTFEAL